MSYNECPCCFLVIDHDEEEKTEYPCTYCGEYKLLLPKNLHKRVARLLEVLHKTQACRLPQVINLIYEDIQQSLHKKVDEEEDF